MKEQIRNGIKEEGLFVLTHFDKNGNVVWEGEAHNALGDEGEQLILDVFLRGATPPASFYVRLYNKATDIADTDTLTTLAALNIEPVGNGYAGIAIERSNVGWPTLTQDTGDFMATTKTILFQASGGAWSQSVKQAVLCTAQSGTTGKVIAYANLSQTRTLADGESLQITYKMKLS